jgi:hypothetical protein
VPLVPERRIALGELDLFIDDGVEQQLRALRRQDFPNETGGVLLGYYDFNIKGVVVVVGLASTARQQGQSRLVRSRHRRPCRSGEGRRRAAPEG